MTEEEQLEQSRRRILALRSDLYRYFVGKNEIIDLMTIAAIAQEPLLLVGQPGTAKSELVLKFTEAIGLSGTDYFEYMLTEFSEPSEILGALDLTGLRDGRFTRRSEGKLPVARVAFLDEIFNASSAILNVLLTILNERKYYDDGRPIPVPLNLLFAATNEIPDHARMAALRDRFCLKVESLSVRSLGVDGFENLIDAGLKNESWRHSRSQPWRAGIASLDDFLLAHKALLSQLGRVRIGMQQRGVRHKLTRCIERRNTTEHTVVLGRNVAQHHAQCGLVKVLHIVGGNAHADSAGPVGHFG